MLPAEKICKLLRPSLTGLILLGPTFLVSETGVSGSCYSFEEGFAMSGPTELGPVRWLVLFTQAFD